MTRRRNLAAACALLLSVLNVPSAAADEAAAWARRLAAQPADVRLQVRLDDGSRAEGYPAAVTADSLLLAAAPGGVRTAACALAAIVGVRREGGGAARGWSVGRNVGAVAGALAGCLFVALADAVGEGDDEVTTTDYAAGTVGMAAVGATAVGGIGALVGSAGDSWYDLPPAAAAPRPRQRLSLQAGLATAEDLRFQGYDGAHLRAWLPRRVSGVVDLGPEATWSGLARTSSGENGRTAEVGDTWSAGLAARFSPGGPGLAPFASVGVGWYGREDSWLGTSIGLGLRWRSAAGNEWDVEVRSHLRSSGLDAEPGNGQMTVTAGWTFGL